MVTTFYELTFKRFYRLKKKIFITQPFLPPFKDYSQLLESIWSSKVLTNSGIFHQKFEKELSNYLNVKYLSIVNNATTGLILAQRALKFKGEIITTDHFGNLISNLSTALLKGHPDWNVHFGDQVLPLVKTYAEAEIGKPLALINAFERVLYSSSETS